MIILEWNNCVKDKWNTKSIYVVGKATASLGERFSSSLCNIHRMLLLILSECGRHLVFWGHKCVNWCCCLQSGWSRSYKCDSLLWRDVIRSLQTSRCRIFLAGVSLSSCFNELSFYIESVAIYLTWYKYILLSTVRSLGLTPLGEDTGTAEVLSRVIIERKPLHTLIIHGQFHKINVRCSYEP